MKSIPFILCLAMLIVSCKQDAPTPTPTTYYSVTMNYGANGTATIKGSTNLQSVLAGTTISIFTIPDSNYVAIVTINGSVVTLVNNTTTFVVNQNATIVVTFKSLAVIYQVKVDTTGTNGNFGTISPLNDSVASGNNIMIYVNLNKGCRIATINCNVLFTSNSDSTIFTIANVKSSINFKIRLTDSLKLAQWQNLHTLLIGSWHLVDYKFSYPNSSIPGMNKWVDTTFNCPDDIEQFTPGNFWKRLVSCSINQSSDSTLFSLTGSGNKIIMYNIPPPNDTLGLPSVTQDSLFYDYITNSGKSYQLTQRWGFKRVK